eukprot:scaffold207397_cov52-Cyclotella_meneghiniana.AAC.6
MPLSRPSRLSPTRARASTRQADVTSAGDDGALTFQPVNHRYGHFRKYLTPSRRGRGVRGRRNR